MYVASVELYLKNLKERVRVKFHIVQINVKMKLENVKKEKMPSKDVVKFKKYRKCGQTKNEKILYYPPLFGGK